MGFVLGINEREKIRRFGSTLDLNVMLRYIVCLFWT